MACAGSRLRKLMGASCVALPGAFNGLVAKAALHKGFEGLYVSGAAVTASMAQPDIGLVSMPEFCKIIRELSVSTNLPIIADADTGFGEE